MKRIAIVLGALLAAQAAPAQDAAAGGASSEVRAAFNPVQTAMISGFACDKDIDTSVAIAYLDKKLGPKKYSAEEVLDLNRITLTYQAMGEAMGTLPKTDEEQARFCKVIMNMYGPQGSGIPGLLKP